MKRYFITGLLIWVPLGITIWVLNLLITAMDVSLWLLPPSLRPEAWLGTSFPGLGAALTLLVIFLTGVVAANIIGQRLVKFWEELLYHIPVVKTIYKSVKQVSDTLFSSQGDAFRKVLLVRFPHSGVWSLAFQTPTPGGEVTAHLDGEHVGVYVPTVPNPTSGYYLLVPKRDVIELDMGVDVALRIVISMGVAVPPDVTARAAPPAPTSP